MSGRFPDATNENLPGPSSAETIVDLEHGHVLASHVGGVSSLAGADGLVLVPVDLDELIGWTPEIVDPDAVVPMLSQTALLDRPAHVLRLIDQARSMGWRIGLRGVGLDAAALALLPLFDPDVIEYDPAVLHSFDAARSAHVFASVGAKAEESGALVLAAGVDSAELRVAARAAGAVGGRGLAFTDTPHKRRTPVLRPTVGRAGHLSTTPSRVAFTDLPVRVSTKPTLIRISHRLEMMATAQLDDVLLLGSFQHVRFFTLATGRRWQAIAEHAALVVALAEDMDAEPAPGVRGVRLDRSDPLRHEWDLVVLTAHFAAVLASRDLGDHGPEHQRRFEYVVSYDRARAIDVARAMMTRVPGEAHPPPALRH